MAPQQDTSGFLNEASVAAGAGDHEKAVTALSKAIKLEKTPRALIFRAESLLALGRAEQAQSDLDEILKLNNGKELSPFMKPIFDALQEKLQVKALLPFAGGAKPEEQLITLLEKFNLEQYSKQILAMAKPAFRFQIANSPIKIGCSRLGGQPDLPQAIEWPLGKDQRPLSFVGQINFGEFKDASVGLPKDGLIYLFYDAVAMPSGNFADKDNGKILQTKDLAKLTKRRTPKNTKEFGAKGISWSKTLSLPATNSAEVNALNLPQNERDSYREVLRHWNSQPAHQLSGHPAYYAGQQCCNYYYSLYAGPEHELEEDDFETVEEHKEYRAKQDLAKKNNPKSATEKRVEENYPVWALLVQIDMEPSLGMDWNGANAYTSSRYALFFFIEPGSIEKFDFRALWVMREGFGDGTHYRV